MEGSVVDVLYAGIIVAKQAPLRVDQNESDESSFFVELADPLPVGTPVEIEDQRGRRPARVEKIFETRDGERSIGMRLRYLDVVTAPVVNLFARPTRRPTAPEGHAVAHATALAAAVGAVLEPEAALPQPAGPPADAPLPPHEVQADPATQAATDSGTSSSTDEKPENSPAPGAETVAQVIEAAPPAETAPPAPRSTGRKTAAYGVPIATPASGDDSKRRKKKR